MHKIFTLFIIKQASYHPEYKKPAAKFPAILDSFLTKVHCSSTVSGEPLHVWRWGWWEGKGINELGRCKDEIGLVMGH